MPCRRGQAVFSDRIRIKWETGLPQRTLTLIASALTIVGLVLLALVLTSGLSSTQINAHEADATIHFEAQRGLVLLAGDCLTVRWQVDGIREVYFDGQPQIGEGEQQVCLDSQTRPRLSIILRDGSQREYTLPITILATDPLFLGGLVTLVAALLLRLTWLAVGLHNLLIRLSTFARRTRLFLRLGIVAASVLMTLLLLDVGLRLYFTRFGTREDRIQYVYSLDEIRAENSILEPMPYVNYIPSPTYPGHNRLGYRGPEITLPKPADTFRIVALGGSTTYSTATSAEDAYPAQLQTILHEQYGYTNVEVINGGFIGYSSWETLVNFEFRVLELEPDMIILYDSVNDIVPREQLSVDCFHGDNPLRGLNSTKGFWVERDTPLSPSVLYRFAAVNLGWMPNPLTLNSWFELPQAACQNDALPVEQRVAQNSAAYFERNLRNTIVIAKANEVLPVLSTWTYDLDQERPDYWRKAVDENNTIIRQLAEEQDTPLVDLAATLPLNAAYWSGDGIHMFPPGTREQAAEYARFLVEAGLIPLAHE
jgi:lysophospholipase L1-like esterase